VLGLQEIKSLEAESFEHQARWGHSTCALGKKKMAVIGGRAEGGLETEVNILNIDSMKWRTPHTKVRHVHSMFAQCSLNVRSMFAQRLLNVHLMFTRCLLNVHSMFIQRSLNVHSMFTQYRLHEVVDPPYQGALSALCSFTVHSMFTQCSLNNLSMFTQCSLDVHSMFTQCHLMFTQCSLNIDSMMWQTPHTKVLSVLYVH
jgi:hypothetical protein